MKRSKTYFQIVLTVFLFISGTATANNIILNGGFEASPNSPANRTINGPVAAMQPAHYTTLTGNACTLNIADLPSSVSGANFISFFP